MVFSSAFCLMLVISSFSSETLWELSRIYTVQKERKLGKQTFQALRGTWQSAEGEPAGFLPSWASLAKAFCVVWLEGDSWAPLGDIRAHVQGIRGFSDWQWGMGVEFDAKENKSSGEGEAWWELSSTVWRAILWKAAHPWTLRLQRMELGAAGRSCTDSDSGSISERHR